MDNRLIDSTDAELVRDARGGDTAAFEALTARHFPMVYALAYARLGAREAAEDLAQEVFLLAYLHLGALARNSGTATEPTAASSQSPNSALADPARFAAWLGRIARNEAGMWRRRSQSASRLVRLVPLDDLPAEPAAPASQDARTALEADEETRALHEALFRLPEALREVVLLHYFEDLSKAEIAARLEVHPATVGRQIEKALKAMKRTLEPILRRAAPAFRHSGKAAARTTLLVGAVAAMSAPAKAALLAEAGASVASLAAATQTVAVATSWHTIFSGGFLMSAKTQFTAVLILLALLAGGAYYQISRTTAAPEVLLAVTGGVPSTDPMAPTSATVALPPDFSRFAAANEANRNLIRTAKVTLLHKSGSYPNPDEAWRSSELKRATEESDARLKSGLEKAAPSARADEIRRQEERIIASERERITGTLEYETREVRYYDYDSGKYRLDSEPAGGRTEPKEPPKNGFTNNEVRFVVIYDSDGLRATYHPLMKEIQIGPEPMSHGAPQPLPCSGTVVPRDRQSLVPIASHAAAIDGHEVVAYEFGQAKASPQSKWRNIVYADPKLGLRYRRDEYGDSSDGGLIGCNLASEYRVVNGVPIPFYCEVTSFWPGGTAPSQREVYRVLEAEINISLPEDTFQFQVGPGTRISDVSSSVEQLELPENHGPLTPQEVRSLALAEKDRKAEQNKKAREPRTVPAPVGIPAPPAR